MYKRVKVSERKLYAHDWHIGLTISKPLLNSPQYLQQLSNISIFLLTTSMPCLANQYFIKLSN